MRQKTIFELLLHIIWIKVHGPMEGTWGNSTDYVLGAMVLGHSIKRTGSPHARVCLHTDDVSQPHLALLSKLWDCRLIQHVDACSDQLSFQVTIVLRPPAT